MISTLTSRIFKGASLLTAKDVLVTLLEGVRVILITHYFSVAEFGIYSLALGTATILSMFVMPQFTSVLQRFHPNYRKENGQKAAQFLGSSFWMTLINGMAMIALGYFFSEWIATHYYQKPETLYFIQMALALTLLQPLTSLMNAVLMSLERFKVIFWGDLIYIGSALGGIMGIASLGGNLKNLIEITMGAYLIRILWFGIALHPLAKSAKPWLEKEIWKFWNPLILSNLFKSITGDLPTIILGRLLTISELGLFQIADKSIRMIFALLDPYVNTITVVCINAYEEARDQFKHLLSFHFRNVALLLLTLTGLSIAIAIPAFDLLYGKEYSAAIPIFIILTIYPLFGGLLFYQRVIYSVTHQTKQYLYFVLISTVFQLPMMWILADQYGVTGAAVSMVISRMIAFALSLLLTTRLMKDAIEIHKLIIPFVLAGFLYVGLIQFLPQTVGQAMITGGIFMAVWGILLALSGNLFFWRRGRFNGVKMG